MSAVSISTDIRRIPGLSGRLSAQSVRAATKFER
jgi:hypothetical protein